MIDIRLIRKDPEAARQALGRRGIDSAVIDAIVLQDAHKRELEGRAQDLKTRRNAVAKKIGLAKKTGLNVDALMTEAEQIAGEAGHCELQAREAGEALTRMLEVLPNFPSIDIPDGRDETSNLCMKVFGKPRDEDWIVPHWDNGPRLGLDIEAGVELAGSRFAVLRGQMALLERALGQFMIEHQIDRGYEEIAVPHIARSEVLYGTGQLPKFGDDLFTVGGDAYLIPTAEVPLTNLIRHKQVAPESLPIRVTALTPCYRAEAGSGGRDTRGYLRQHQFHKVELVSIVRESEADDEFERLTRCAETVLEKLGLTFRRMLLCAGDMGFSATMTYDLEVWMPGQRQWREISSCSMCGDFQMRRMKTRIKGDKEALNSLNGSGLAVGRTLVAILETYQEPNGDVTVPDVLQPYMRGRTLLSASTP